MKSIVVNILKDRLKECESSLKDCKRRIDISQKELALYQLMTEHTNSEISVIKEAINENQ